MAIAIKESLPRAIFYQIARFISEKSVTKSYDSLDPNLAAAAPPCSSTSSYSQEFENVSDPAAIDKFESEEQEVVQSDTSSDFLGFSGNSLQFRQEQIELIDRLATTTTEPGNKYICHTNFISIRQFIVVRFLNETILIRFGSNGFGLFYC